MVWEWCGPQCCAVGTCALLMRVYHHVGAIFIITISCVAMLPMTVAWRVSLLTIGCQQLILCKLLACAHVGTLFCWYIRQCHASVSCQWSCQFVMLGCAWWLRLLCSQHHQWLFILLAFLLINVHISLVTSRHTRRHTITHSHTKYAAVPSCSRHRTSSTWQFESSINAHK